MPSPNPAVLIIHGGYFLPASWATFGDQLTKSELTVCCPRLPSCDDSRPPTATLREDVTAIRTAAKDLIATGHSIIVLAHSYGGIVASEALTPDLYTNESRIGIVSLILLSAWLIQPGSSLLDVITKYGFQCEVDLGRNEDGTVFAKNAAESFYNDIDPATAGRLAMNNVTHNWNVASGMVSGAPWKDLPTTYVHCLRDLAIMLPLQKSMVEDAVHAGGQAELLTEIVDSGHCPFLSRPDELVKIVKKAVSNAK